MEPEVRELSPDIVEKTAVDPAMEAREEEEEEDLETLLESLRGLFKRGRFSLRQKEVTVSRKA